MNWKERALRAEASLALLRQGIDSAVSGREQSPLDGRPGLRTSHTHPLVKELGELAKRRGLRGCVLISFTNDRVGVNSCGEPDLFGKAMETLADRILAKIDDGEFDP